MQRGNLFNSHAALSLGLDSRLACDSFKECSEAKRYARIAVIGPV